MSWKYSLFVKNSYRDLIKYSYQYFNTSSLSSFLTWFNKVFLELSDILNMYDIIRNIKFEKKIEIIISVNKYCKLESSGLT